MIASNCCCGHPRDCTCGCKGTIGVINITVYGNYCENAADVITLTIDDEKTKEEERKAAKRRIRAQAVEREDWRGKPVHTRKGKVRNLPHNRIARKKRRF